ncbi:MAG: hypothetical protein AAB391_02105 [Patescibacteria group bacterium]
MKSTLRLPTKLFGHCLAFPCLSITEAELVKMLRYCRDECGLHGLVVVAVLVHESLTPKRMAQIFKREKMRGLICGFLGNTGPDPFMGGADACLLELERQAQYTLALVKAKVGDPILCGPVHTRHMTMRPNWGTDNLIETAFLPWMKKLDALAKKLGIKILCEALNMTEDGTWSPFSAIAWAIKTGKLENLGLHLDIGHWAMQGMSMDAFADLSALTGYFEWANIGRHPLRLKEGIDMRLWAQNLHLLPKGCVMGVETFHDLIIKTFGLGTICTTKTDGKKCLRMDAKFLRMLGVARHRKLTVAK